MLLQGGLVVEAPPERLRLDDACHESYRTGHRRELAMRQRRVEILHPRSNVEILRDGRGGVSPGFLASCGFKVAIKFAFRLRADVFHPGGMRV
jgi:hypothetical protein